MTIKSTGIADSKKTVSSSDASYHSMHHRTHYKGNIQLFTFNVHAVTTFGKHQNPTHMQIFNSS